MIHTLPLEMIYRILDHLNDKQLFLSMSNVCQRFNTILSCYQRYQVNNISIRYIRKFFVSKTLTHLNLYHKKIDHEDVRYFSETLKQNSVTITLLIYHDLFYILL